MSSLLPGTVIAERYQLVELLGRGGHGAVYRALQRPLGREVALKMMLVDALAGEGALERFAREAKVVQSLEHPHTVRLYDFGTTDQGMPFSVFELLRGPTLEQEIEKGPFAAHRVGHVASQILKSLMEAHGKGIVHRDIKPSNVLLLEYSGEKDFVKVLDFGVARPIAAAAPREQITHAGQIIGTPAYMAPEQVHEGAIGPATDLYALGLVMTEALTGKQVYADGSPIQVWMRQTSPDPVPLSAAVTTSPFGAVIARATRKAIGERYASAAEMLSDVERAMARLSASEVAVTSPLAAPIQTPHNMPAYQPSTARISAPNHTPSTARISSPNHTPPAAGQSSPHHTPQNPWQSYGPPPANATPPVGHAAGPFTSAPAQGYVGPMAPASGPGPSSRAGSGSRGLIYAVVAIVAVVVIVLVIVAAGIGGAILARRAPDDAPQPTTTGTANGPPVAVGASGRLKAVTGPRIDQRLRAAGWNVTANQAMNSPGFQGAFFSAQRGTTGALVQLYDYESAPTAMLTESAMKKNSPSGGVVERDGGRVLYVAVIQDASQSRALFDEIVGQ